MPRRFADGPPEAGGGERGVALVLVLWILALLAILVVGFSGDARTQLRLARNQNEAAAAQAIADAGLAFAILGVFDPTPATRWRADGLEHLLSYGGGALRVRLQDEGGKLDLNVAPLYLLGNLFQTLGLAAADQLVDEIAAVRAAHAKDDAGGAAAPDLAPAFAAIDELRRMPGMDRESYARIAPYVTVHSNSPLFDLMTAPRPVLLSMPGVQEDAVDQFITERSAAGVTASDLALVAGHRDFAAGAPVRVFTMTSEAATANGTRFIREAVVMLSDQAEAPYRLLSWRSAVAAEPDR